MAFISSRSICITLANDTGAQEQFVRNDFGVSRIFAESGNEIL
jgi:hypothetical protein